VIPTSLPDNDVRDLYIAQKQIFGIKKADVLSGYNYERPEINKNLAKMIFLALSKAFEKHKTNYNNLWTVFDNLDKAFCLQMAVYFESQISDQPFKKELSQYLLIKNKKTVSESDASNQWRKNKRRNRENRIAKKSKKEPLPKLIARLEVVCKYIDPFVNVINSTKEFLKLFRIHPVALSESQLFQVPFSTVDTVREEYEYSINVLQLAIHNDTEDGHKAISKFILPDSFQKIIFSGDGFTSIKNMMAKNFQIQPNESSKTGIKSMTSQQTSHTYLNDQKIVGKINLVYPNLQNTETPPITDLKIKIEDQNESASKN
jgi:hypothetical protein